jgi:ribosomal protein S27AE
MVKLYYLLKENPFIPDQEIAKKLGVKVKTVQQYKWRLKNFVESNGNSTKFCPECCEDTLIYDHESGEYVCRRCGFVVEDNSLAFADFLPWDTTYALTSNIAFGKSLGDTLPKRYLHKVIAKSENGDEDLPIRATQIRILSHAVDPPVIKSMINYGSRLMKQLGLYKDTEFCHLFADRYGRLLRKLGAFIQISKLDVQPYLIARAALYYLLKKTDSKKAEEAREKFPFSNRYLSIVKKLEELDKEA